MNNTRMARTFCAILGLGILSLSGLAPITHANTLLQAAPILEAPAPKISWITPAGSTLYPSPTVSVDVLATPVGSTLPITKVQFYLNGSTTPLATLGSPVAGSPNTYRLTVDSSVLAPSYTQTNITLVAEAINKVGKKRKTASQSFVIKPPVLRITAPSNGAQLLSNAPINQSMALAMNPAAPYNKIECWAGASKVAEVLNIASTATSANCSYSLTQTGSQTLQAKAFNGTVQVALSPTVLVTVCSDTPPVLNFAPKTGTLGAVVESAPVTVTGLCSNTPMSIISPEGEYSLNGGAWTRAAGTLKNGDVLKLRAQNSSVVGVGKTVTVNLPNVLSTEFSVTAAAVCQ